MSDNPYESPVLAEVVERNPKAARGDDLSWAAITAIGFGISLAIIFTIRIGALIMEN